MIKISYYLNKPVYIFMTPVESNVIEIYYIYVYVWVGAGVKRNMNT